MYKKRKSTKIFNFFSVVILYAQQVLWGLKLCVGILPLDNDSQKYRVTKVIYLLLFIQLFNNMLTLYKNTELSKIVHFPNILLSKDTHYTLSLNSKLCAAQSPHAVGVFNRLDVYTAVIT